MPPSRPTDLTALDRLAAHETVRLIRALAEEECGLSTATRTGINAHCASREHAHKSGSNTESLAVRPAKKFMVKRGGAEFPGGKFLECFGCCGFKGSVSEYLRNVGPEGSAEEFWTPAKVKGVSEALAAGEPLNLGWLDWKRAKGLSATGVVARESTIAPITQASSQSVQKFMRVYRENFEGARPSDDLISEVCSKRKWDRVVVEKALSEGILGLTRSNDYEDDIKLAFAYRGLFRTEGHPVRLIKTRLLNRGVDDAPMSRVTTLNPGADAAPVADFSEVGVSVQTASTLSLVEGEPDALSWRSMRPQDGVLCVGNEWAYSRIMDVIPMLNLDKRRVIYCLDVDLDEKGFWKKKNPGNDFLVMRSLQEAGARVHLWACPRPKVPGYEAKDVNDFLKLAGGKRDPADYSVLVDARSVGHLLAKCAEIGLPVKPGVKEQIGGLFSQLRESAGIHEGPLARKSLDRTAA